VSWKCGEHEVDEYNNRCDTQQYPGRDPFLQSYSEAEFTFNEDCLIALQGLASEMQIARNDHYYFGIWSANLPEQLLWMREGIFADGLPDAPSWSWASKLGSKIFWSTQFRSKPNCNGIRPETVSIEDSGMMKIRDAYIKECTTSEPSILCSSCTSQIGLKNARLIMEKYVHEDAHCLRALENSSKCPFGVAILDGELSPDLHCLYVLQTEVEDLAGIVKRVRSYNEPIHKISSLMIYSL
jgi:hypothetical protein